MAWRIEVAAEAEHDLALLFQHFADSYRVLGASRDEAAGQAATRVRRIVEATGRLAIAPHRGASHDDWLPGLRHLTLDGAIYWFQVQDTERRIRVLAIFFGGQDHQRGMLLRLLQP